MISKTDILMLLSNIDSQEAKDEIRKLYTSEGVPLSAIKLINDNRALDLSKFYEKLRRSHNENKSKLYINIMKSTENSITDVNTIITTLTALLNQIFQFKCDDRIMFLKHARADEISKVIAKYTETFDTQQALKLLTMFKADIMALETAAGRR